MLMHRMEQPSLKLTQSSFRKHGSECQIACTYVREPKPVFGQAPSKHIGVHAEGHDCHETTALDPTFFNFLHSSSQLWECSSLFGDGTPKNCGSRYNEVRNGRIGDDHRVGIFNHVIWLCRRKKCLRR